MIRIAFGFLLSISAGLGATQLIEALGIGIYWAALIGTAIWCATIFIYDLALARVQEPLLSLRRRAQQEVSHRASADIPRHQCRTHK